jgi:hypothetical protein
MTIELNRTERGTATLLDCFSCGRPFTYRDPKADGTSGRFCSDPCREWFDAGNPPYAPIGRLYGLPIGTHGFVINCAACGGDFDSKGLRCCSPECERKHRDRQENAKAMSAVGMEPAEKRRCEECGRNLPRWRNGRQVSKATRFCAPRCQAKNARKRVSASNPVPYAETTKKSLFHAGSQRTSAGGEA